MPKVALSDWMRPRWWLVAYLIDPDSLKHLRDVIDLTPDKRFDQALERYTRAFIVDGKLPPEPIASAVYNVADDLRHGRSPTIRLGDYIAIQNYVRKNA